MHAHIKVGEGHIEVRDIDGISGYHLCSLNDWDEGVALPLAELEAITLTPEHWSVLKILGDYYSEYLIVLNKRTYCKHNNDVNAIQKLELLFPKGINQAAGIGGLPYPTCFEQF